MLCIISTLTHALNSIYYIVHQLLYYTLFYMLNSVMYGILCHKLWYIPQKCILFDMLCNYYILYCTIYFIRNSITYHPVGRQLNYYTMHYTIRYAVPNWTFACYTVQHYAAYTVLYCTVLSSTLLHNILYYITLQVIQ